MFERDLYAGLGLGPAVFFDRGTFGVDRLAARAGRERRVRAERPQARPTRGRRSWPRHRCRRPLQARHRAPRQGIHRPPPGLDDDAEEGASRADRATREFPVKSAGCHPDVLPFFQARPHSLYGLGIDAGLGARRAGASGLPGFAGMALRPTCRTRHGTRRTPRTALAVLALSRTATRRSPGCSSGGWSHAPSPAAASTTWRTGASTTRGLDEPGPGAPAPRQHGRARAPRGRWHARGRDRGPLRARRAAERVRARAVCWRAGAL